jgi:hypothetical protein
MAHEIFLSPAWEAADAELPVSRLHDVAHAVVTGRDDRWHVEQLTEGQFGIEFPEGQASVLPTHVAFRLSGISAPLAYLIHALAKAAKVAILNEGGGPHVLLVDPRHIDLLPPDLRKDDPVVCETPEQLLAALGPCFELPVDETREALRRRDELYARWTRDHVVRSIGTGDPEPNLPGLSPPTGDQRPVYVRMKPKEGPLQMGRRLARFGREQSKAGRLADEDFAPWHGSSWQVRVPTGDVFNCMYIGPNYRDDTTPEARRHRIEKGVDQFRDFAAATGRCLATLEPGGRFVLSDGRAYALEECESRRARDDDG